MLAAVAQNLEADLAFLQTRLNTLKTAMQRIKTYGQQPGQWSLEDLQTAYRTVSGQLAAIRQQYNRADLPPELLVRLDKVGDDVINAGRDLAAMTGKVVGGVATTAQMLPLLLVGVLIVAGIGLSKGTLTARV